MKRSFPVVVLLCCLWAGACRQETPLVNQLSENEKKEGWKLLFDGKTFDQWHIYNKGDTASVWVVQNEELYCRPLTTAGLHGDLVSDEIYKNFEFVFDWKISEGGNSGVFINVQERPEIPAAWASGPEYQVLDVKHPDYTTNPKKRAGCLYGFYEQRTTGLEAPTGEWNTSRIIQNNGIVEFYLNGTLTASQDFNTHEWKEMVAASTFSRFPEFGKYTEGKIGLQDWAKGISFRNLKIKPL